MRSASALAAANNNLDESIALVTAMNSTVQDAAKVGNAMKTLAAYLRSSKVELEELGETGELVAETTPKLQEKMVALTHGAVQILERDGQTIRSTYDIMKDLSKIWDTGFLTDKEQAAILEMIAGKRQSSTVASLLQNFTVAEEVLESAANSAGSAIAENEKYLDSINGKIARFQASFEQLSANVMNSDMVKGFYDFLTGVVNAFNQLVSTTPAVIRTFGLLGGAIGGVIGHDLNLKPLEVFQSIKGAFSGGNAVYKDIMSATAAISDYNKAASISVETGQAFAESTQQSQMYLNEYLQSLKGGSATQLGYVAYLKEHNANLTVYTIRTTAAAVATRVLNTALNAVIGMGISVAFGYIVNAIDQYIHRLDNAIDQTEKLNAEWEDFQKKNRDSIKTVESLRDEFERLSKGVDDAGENISLTAEEYDRYIEIVNTLIEINPYLVEGYNRERDAIISKNDAIQKTIDLLKEEAKQEKLRQSTTPYMTELLKGYGAQAQKDRAGLSEAEQRYNESLISFVTNGNSTISLTNARKILSAIGKSGTSLTPYLSQANNSGTRTVDGRKFAAEFLDEIVQNIDDINPKLFGYNNKAEMTTAYREVLGSKIEVDKQRELVDATLVEIRKAFYSGVETLAGWDDLTSFAQQAVYDYIDNYITEYRDLFDYNKFNGDLEVSPSKLSAVMSQFTGVAMSLLDDATVSLLNQLEEARTSRNSGGISQGQYREKYDEIMETLRKTVDNNLYFKIEAEFDPSNVTEGFNSIVRAADEMDQAVQAIMENLEVDAEGFTDALDFTDAITSIDDLGDSLSNLATALLKVQDGTMLTAQEINKLIAEYPDLVQAGDLYAAETIENQEAILKNFLNSKETQYKATIEEKIAVLEAERDLLSQQIELENQKASIIAETRQAMNEGSIKSAKAYQDAVAKLQELEKSNFVSLAEGKIKYNAESLSKMLANDTEYAQKSQDFAWQPHANDIAASLDEAFKAATAEIDSMLQAEATALSSFQTNVLAEMSRDVKRALRGEMTDTGGYGQPKLARLAYKGITPNKVGSTARGKSIAITPGSLNNDYVDIQAADYADLHDAMKNYLDTYERQIQSNVRAYEAERESINNMIASLNSHKNIDLAKIYGTPPSSKSSGTKKDKAGSKEKEAKTVEEYKADLDAYYAAEKKLAEIQYRRAQLEKQLADTTDLEEKIKIERELIKVYGEESEAQGEIKRLKEETIEQNVRALQQLGFEVEYNAATHQLYIDNQELLNEITADTKGDFETIEEATNDLRKTTEALIQSTEKLAGECGDASDAMYDLGKQTEESNKRIIEYLDEMVSKANEVVDGFQNIYDTFTKAAREYASTGFLSVDSLQAILELGPKYLQMLYDESGQLKINKERIQDIIRARTQEMGVQTAYAHVQQIIWALDNDKDEVLQDLVQTTKDLTKNTWLSVYALAAQADTMAKAKGKTDLFEFSVVDQVRQIEAMTNTTISSLEEYQKSLEDGYVTQADALQDVIDQTIEYIKWENEQKSDAIQNELDAYKDIVDQKKKMLQLAREEDKHNQDVEDKLREIAKLQRKIDQLSLDDSREAQAQKASLTEQLYQLQRDLESDMADESVSAAEDALDSQYEAFEDEKNKELDAIKKGTQSYERLWHQAVDSLEKDWQGMYQKIIAFNTEYGNSLNSEITSKWEQAIKAVQRYGSVVEALEGVKSDENIGVDQTPDYAIYQATVRQNIASMKANSIRWLTADTHTRDLLAAENERLGVEAGLNKVNGAWYLPNGERAYQLSEDEYRKPISERIIELESMLLKTSGAARDAIYEEIRYLKQTLADLKAIGAFHTGGIVGTPNLKQNEVMAVLQKGEVVLDRQKESALYKLVDFATILQTKIGKVFDASMLSAMSRSATPTIPSSQLYASGAGGGFNFAPSVTVEINHSGELSENDARRYGDIVADAALEKLTDAFGRRGITNYSASLLKGAGA